MPPPFGGVGVLVARELPMIDPSPANRPVARLSTDWLALVVTLVLAALVRAEVIGDVPW